MGGLISEYVYIQQNRAVVSNPLGLLVLACMPYVVVMFDMHGKLMMQPGFLTRGILCRIADCVPDGE